MKLITFKKIEIQNFLSIGPEPVIIEFKPGVNFITGENLDVPGTKNGVGKSAIVAAFSFVIFGKTLKKLDIGNIPNNLINQTTKVVLEFNCNSPKGNNNFKIVRELNPSSLKVYKDGREKTKDSIANTTNYILEVLSTSQEVFKNCIAMQANNIIPFMSQGKVEKKKFIESLFNLDVIIRMFKSVKDDINISKRELDIETKLIEQIDKNISDYQNKQQRQIEKSKTEEERRKIEIEEIQKDINKLLSKFSILSEKGKALEIEKNNFNNSSEAIQKDINKVSKFKLKLSSDIGINKTEKNNIFNKIEKIKKFGPVCDKCNRPFTTEDKIEIENSIKELKNEFDKKIEKEKYLLDLIKKADNLYDSKQNELKNFQELERKINNNESDIKFIKNSIKLKKELLEQYNNYKKQVNDNDVFNELIEKASEEKTKKTEIIKGINNSLAKFEIARFILSEEGIRAYIIKKLLDLLNFRIKYYLTKQNSQYLLSFNEVFEEEILNKKGLLVSYGNLSGAESKMLDLACTWAFRDILKLQGSVSYNISFYDEILDSSLDKTNSEIICKILEEFAEKENQSIYLISHKPDFFKVASGEIIQLEKKNGITKRSTF